MRAFFCDGILCDGFIWKYLWNDLAELCDVQCRIFLVPGPQQFFLKRFLLQSELEVSLNQKLFYIL